MDFYLNSIDASGRNQLVKRVIPIEILFDIISRVPVEGVFETKLVCKTWLGVSKMPEFDEKHLQSQLLRFHHFHNYKYYPHFKNSNGAGDMGILFYVVERDVDDEDESYYGLAYADYNENGNSESTITYPKKLRHINICSADQLIGSCDGLICLSRKNHAYVSIWNPSTREHVDLQGCGKNKKVCYGFGCDDAGTKNYKVVRIIYDEKKQPGCDALVQVYTLGSGAGWRNKGRIAHSFENDPGLLTDRALHWLDNNGKIWAFDLADEEFNFVTQTPSKNGNFPLAILGGWLSYFQHGTNSTTLWSFNKITKEQQSRQWSAVFSLWMPRNCLPFALTITGGVLYWEDNKYLSVYNPENEAPENLDIKYFRKMNSKFSGILHVKSFLSLKTIGEKYVKIIGSDGHSRVIRSDECSREGDLQEEGGSQQAFADVAASTIAAQQAEEDENEVRVELDKKKQELAALNSL